MRDGKGPQWPGRAEGATIRGNRQVLDEKIKYSSFAAKSGQTGPGERGGEMMEVTRGNYYHATISLTVSSDALDSFLLPANKSVSLSMLSLQQYERYQKPDAVTTDSLLI